MKFTFSTLVFAAAAASAVVVPKNIRHAGSDDVEITSPDTDSVWQLGGSYTVTWSVSESGNDDSTGEGSNNATEDDAQYYNYNQRRTYGRGSNSGSLYLYKSGNFYGYPLAKDIDLSSGSQEVTVPTNITSGDEYRVLLFAYSPKKSGDDSDGGNSSDATSSSTSSESTATVTTEDSSPTDDSAVTDDASSYWSEVKRSWFGKKKHSFTFAYSEEFTIEGSSSNDSNDSNNPTNDSE